MANSGRIRTSRAISRREKERNTMPHILSLRVGADTRKVLETAARQGRCRVSDLLREALDSWIAIHGEQLARTAAARSRDNRGRVTRPVPKVEAAAPPFTPQNLQAGAAQP